MNESCSNNFKNQFETYILLKNKIRAFLKERQGNNNDKISMMTVLCKNTFTILMYDRFNYIYVKKVYKKFIVAR